jgi:DNA polymerase III subunit gamma/tau
VSTALYRRYRPESFADVIGQDHVTGPLMQALRTGRVNHAYLFSGPRGCGKTTSARILARCLNCAEGPTENPCRTCDSCLGLARGGPGTVDVIEIDAASHGGVDDARDLREKASFGPASSRHKVYIIDEAHMVTSAGFNALLKVVEEPPPHVKFIFATTEPDKVIGTIRSRTHHYPFRLVPPARLQDYLTQICEAEDVPVGKGVLPLVVRAGGGSVRDSLSVLDQLIAGSAADGLTYAGAVALLGYTDDALLDSMIDAIAAVDAATAFRVVDRVIESGHDPRRFVEDLLERLRDLIVVSAVPDGAEAVLRGLAEDQLDRMRQQALRFGPAELSRAADVVNTGLTELTGATAPRLQLELLSARILLPAADGDGGHGARLDRIERRLAAGTPAAAEPGPDRLPPAPPSIPDPTPEPIPEPALGAEPAPPVEAAPAAEAPPPVEEQSPSAGPRSGRPVGAIDVVAVRQAWPEVTRRLFSMKKVTFMLVKDAQVVAFEAGRLTLGIASEGAAANFRGGRHAEHVRQALRDELALDVQIDVVHGDRLPGQVAGPGPAAGGAPSEGPGGSAGSGASGPVAGATAVDSSVVDPTATDSAAEPPGWGASPPRAEAAPSGANQPRVRAQPTPPDLAGGLAADQPSVDDEDVEGSAMVGRPVVERLLGGQVIDETDG